jgi:hypothetical protein
MTADPWALLREARDTLDSEASTPEELDFVFRIDAALAAHRDEVPAQDSTKDVVEWRLGDDCDEEFVYYEAYPDSDTGLDVVRFLGGKWRWTMSREKQGYCDTLDEARRAATSAARGMR